MKSLTILPALSLFIFSIYTAAVFSKQNPQFVTSPACKDCHSAQYDDWSNSHHAWAWRLPTPDNVLGDFNGASFEHQGINYKFEVVNGAYYVTADDRDGLVKRYPLAYTAGIEPLQQYLIETEPGRLQALDIAWDTAQKRWFHLYPDQELQLKDGMHWTGPYKNWNSRCAECHATDYQKKYDPKNDLYHSYQAEIGVGCEACHGPGSAHLEWADNNQTFDAGHWLNVDSLGLSILKGDKIDRCTGCHSRRTPLGASSPIAGEPFNDHYRLAMMTGDLYFNDGQIRDEVYVYGSFAQSKMHARGVTCTHCHDAHTYRLKRKGNATCTYCHQPSGNPDFPTLRKAQYDDPTHHFHTPGSDAAICVNCHMPERKYMVVDGRRDHSFRIPRPDLTADLGTPDPCMSCHIDKTPAWAADSISIRFQNGQTGQPHFAHLFTSAANHPSKENNQALLRLATNKDKPAFIRASAVQNIDTNDTGIALDLKPLIKDESPWVRAAVVDRLGMTSHPERDRWVASTLDDDTKIVRIAAAQQLLRADLPPEFNGPLRHAITEMQQSLVARADYPETQMMIGGMALILRNLNAAKSAFQRTVEMDPQRVDAWNMLAEIELAGNQPENAITTLQQALEFNPGQSDLQQMLDSLQPVQPR